MIKCVSDSLGRPAMLFGLVMIAVVTSACSQRECEVAADCGDGSWICDEEGRCQEILDPCADLQCPGAQTCVDGECAGECCDENTCPPYESCDEDRCRDVAVSNPCLLGSPCAPPCPALAVCNGQTMECEAGCLPQNFGCDPPDLDCDDDIDSPTFGQCL